MGYLFFSHHIFIYLVWLGFFFFFSVEGNVDLLFLSNVSNLVCKQINNDHKHFERGSVRILYLKRIRTSFLCNINSLLVRNNGTSIISEQLLSFLE